MPSHKLPGTTFQVSEQLVPSYEAVKGFSYQTPKRFHAPFETNFPYKWNLGLHIILLALSFYVRVRCTEEHSDNAFCEWKHEDARVVYNVCVAGFHTCLIELLPLKG